MKRVDLIGKAGVVLVLALIIGLFPFQQGLTQTEGRSRYFPETGHTVRDALLDFFETRGELAIFGYPITEAFYERGVLVQYFQNARLEWRPNNPDPYKVQLGLLGDELHYSQPRVEAPQISSRRRVYFPETGHTLSYAFLDYFNTNGGLDTFGYPITEMHYSDGIIVQYFQRLKMEWHPEDRANPVHIGNLGELYVNIYRDRIPAAALARTSSTINTTPTPAATGNITSIRAVVSLRYSVMGKQGNQTVSVLVTDNAGKALAGAQVSIRFINPAGQMMGAQSNLLTDDRGFARISIPVTGGRTGEQVVVQADVTYGALTHSAQNVFLLWW